MTDLKSFAIRLLVTILTAPLFGWLLLIFVEKSESYWKSKDRKKRWMVLCGVFFIIVGLGRWLN